VEPLRRPDFTQREQQCHRVATPGQGDHHTAVPWEQSVSTDRAPS
jgi:hypothetical protein